MAVGLKPMPFPGHYHRVRNVEGVYNDVAGKRDKPKCDDRLRAEGCPVDSDGRADPSANADLGG